MSETIADLTARLGVLRLCISKHQQTINELEREVEKAERERLRIAPRGTYCHRRDDNTEITVSAALIEFEGEAIRIQYSIPRHLARRGEEDDYIRWLRTKEQLARFTLGATV